MQGYHGKILFVDLSAGVIHDEVIEDVVYQNYLAGIGLATHILYDRIPKDADPLGPDNILAFVPGLLTGTGTLFAGRWMAAAKSPLTGTWGESNCGGTLAAGIKHSGYDGIFFQGISPKPVYLYVGNGKAEIKDASHIWGKDTVETEEILTQEAKSKKTPIIASIGQAGENLSLIAGISNEKGRMAGRSGLGAVMGAKKLKAVVFTGAKKVPCADRDSVRTLSTEYYKKYVEKTSMPKLPGFLFKMMGKKAAKAKTLKPLDGLMTIGTNKRWGTVLANQMSIESGDAPIRNWAGTNESFKKQSNSINPNKIIAKAKSSYHCYACPVGCGHICIMENSKYSETHKPEYETVIGLSALLLNGDLDSIFYLNEYMNRAAIDSISTAGTLAFAIECYENGLITKEDTGGLELAWGNTKSIVRLVEMIINREGIGDILADGTKAAAKRIGKDSEKYAINAGGQELAMHDSRLDPGLGLGYSVEPTPGRHTISSYGNYEMYRIAEVIKEYPMPPASYPVEEKYKVNEDNVLKVLGCSLVSQIVNGCGICNFAIMTGIDRYPLFQYINAATGWNKTPEEYLEIGKRIQTLKQMFNVYHGINPWKLKISPRAMGLPPLEKGPHKGRTYDLDKMMKMYWNTIGWNDETGIPTVETISKLGLETRAF